MTDQILIALISFAGTLAGSLAGIFTASRLSNYRIEQLEKKVDKHNNLVERVYLIEQHEAVNDNKIKTAEHRIADLENEQNKEKTLVFIVHGGTIMTIFERFSGTKKGYYDWQTENLSGYLADAVLKNSPPQSLETALHLENIAQVKNL